MRKSIKTLLAFAAALAATAAMSGCLLIQSQSSAQLDGIGDVQITTTVCSSDTDSNATPARPACQGASTGGNSGNDTNNQSTQFLIAYRIPVDATAPDSFTTIDPGGGSAFTFDKSPSYTSQLTTAFAPGAARKWVGYISSTQNYVEVGGSQEYFVVAPRFGLPQSSDGSAFDGPFNYRSVVGERVVDGTRLAGRPVACGSSVTAFDTGEGIICADSPSSATISTDTSQPTQDLGILDAPGTESVNAGNVLRVKFGVDYAGDGNPAPTFDLSASTDIPGGTVEPSTPVLTPDDGITRLRAITQVPVDTPPGHYDVTLTATLPGGEVRSSTHDVLVTPTTVRCSEYAPTIAGTPEDDVLVGTSGPDVIAGYAGNDQILGLGGNDVVCAGRGNDILRGGAGNDKLAGRRGDDLLTGGSGRNVIDPGPGKDQMIQ
jgi:Ca2+-binding RTX toxin-like protein